MWKNSVTFVSRLGLGATVAAGILLAPAALAGSKGSGGKVKPHDISIAKQKSSTTNATNKQRFDPYKNFKFR